MIFLEKYTYFFLVFGGGGGGVGSPLKIIVFSLQEGMA